MKHDRTGDNRTSTHYAPSVWGHIVLLLALAANLCTATGNLAAAPLEPAKRTVTPIQDESVPALPALDNPGLLRAGGPDGGGYIYRDSDESDGPTYSFEDITASGTQALLGDDEMSAALRLGFDFDFYGQTYTHVYVCSNGYITFLPDQFCSYTPTSLPNAAAPNAMIAAWWEDLYPTGGGRIDYQMLGTAPYRRFLVQYTAVPHYDGKKNTKDPVTLQIKLFETSDAVEVHYLDTNKVNSLHVAGIENETGSTGLLYRYESNTRIQSTAVRYWIPRLSLTKEVDAPTPLPGQRIIYTLHAYNTTGADLTDVVVTDTLPSGLTIAGATTLTPSQPGANLGPPPTLASSVTVPSWGAIAVQFPVTVSEALSGGTVLVNEAAASSDSADLFMGDTVEIVVNTCQAKIAGESTIYPTVQQAIDAAGTDDVVQLAGYCAGVQVRGGLPQTAHITKTLTLRGGYSPDFSAWDAAAYTTTLDALNQGRTLYMAGAVSPVIEHLTVTGGNATGLAGDPFGDDAGGGIYVITAMATISACRVMTNTAGPTGWGGGIYLRNSTGTLYGNTVTGNTAYGGAGVEVDDSSGSLIAHNTVVGNQATAGGGGIYLYRSAATLDSNIIRLNTATNGGGVYITAEAPRLTNTLIADNEVSGAGAGLYISGATPALVHTTLAGNTGGSGSGVTLVSNLTDSTAAFTNTILVSHTLGIEAATGNTAHLTATLWSNTTDVSGSITRIQNIYGNPAFVNPTSGDYRINTWSNAFDGGILTTVTSDIDGDARVTARCLPNPPDLGADENPALTVLRPISDTLTFGAAQATMAFTDTGSLQAVTVTLELSYPTSKSSNRPLRRTYTIDADTPDPFSGVLTLYYTDEEVTESGSVESGLLAYREVDGRWYAQPAIVNTVANTVEVPEVSGFSRWALGDADHSPENPTAVTLVAVSASPSATFYLAFAAALLLLAAVPALVLRRRQ